MQLSLAESVGVGRHVVSWCSITDPLPSLCVVKVAQSF